MATRAGDSMVNAAGAVFCMAAIHTAGMTPEVARQPHEPATIELARPDAMHGAAASRGSDQMR